MFLTKVFALCLCCLTFANCCAANWSWREKLPKELWRVETRKVIREIKSFDILKINDETPEAEMEFTDGSGHETRVSTDYESDTEMTTLYADENFTLVFLEEFELEVTQAPEDYSFITTEIDENEMFSTTQLYSDDETSSMDSTPGELSTDFEDSQSTIHPVNPYDESAGAYE